MALELEVSRAFVVGSLIAKLFTDYKLREISKNVSNTASHTPKASYSFV